ncbi:putative RNA-directed DNA polymerase [Helianthus annuus]|nr:putative RNA-directed DNA polymerase [Helianthus annuus]
MRVLLHQQGNLHKKVELLRNKLDDIQKSIQLDPLDVNLRVNESECVQQFQEASLDEERFLKQKSKVQWLAEGDANTSFFHVSLKCKNHRNRIYMIKDNDGVLYEGGEVPNAFVNHFEKFLGIDEAMDVHPSPDLFTHTLDDMSAEFMVWPVQRDEVKNVMFSIGDNKAPGADGYTSAFFKKTWSVIRDDVIKAVQDFFEEGKLLQELNHTIIALVPKVVTPSIVMEYRPISCCNVVYKCISKIMADRIKDYLRMIVSISQSAFVPGKKITDNILLTQELMHNYHRNAGPPRCAFKIDACVV